MNKITTSLSRIYKKATAGAVMLTSSAITFAFTGTDLTQDVSGGRTLNEMAESGNTTIEFVVTLMIAVFAFIGLILVATSLLSLHRAAKEEREKPAGAIIGILVGGALLGLTTIAFIVRNTLTGQ